VAVPVVPIIEIVNSSLRFTHVFSFGYASAFGISTPSAASKLKPASHEI
jgi:gamma-glutamyl phosphate reductase